MTTQTDTRAALARALRYEARYWLARTRLYLACHVPFIGDVQVCLANASSVDASRGNRPARVVATVTRGADTVWRREWMV